MKDVLLFARGLLSYLPEGSYLTCQRICPTCKRDCVLHGPLSYLHARGLLSYLQEGFYPTCTSVLHAFQRALILPAIGLLSYLQVAFCPASVIPMSVSSCLTCEETFCPLLSLLSLTRNRLLFCQPERSCLTCKIFCPTCRRATFLPARKLLSYLPEGSCPMYLWTTFSPSSFRQIAYVKG
jgi:hypothetical protein